MGEKIGSSYQEREREKGGGDQNVLFLLVLVPASLAARGATALAAACPALRLELLEASFSDLPVVGLVTWSQMYDN
jgi:hypothetical protein